MLIQARVVKQTKAGVEAETYKDCGACKACQPKTEKFQIKTRKKYKKGQQITIKVNTVYFWRALGLLICLPIITLLIVLSALLKSGLPEILAAAIFLLVCLTEYIAVYFYDRKIKTADLYKII